MKHLMNNIKTTFKTFIALSILASGVGVYADDTEVFYSLNVSKPNLMFVLDISGSMGGTLDGSGDIITVDQSITHASADSRQNNNGGSTSLNDTSIEISSSKLTRFRFDNLGIPEDSEITLAYIQFEAGVPANPGLNNDNAKFYVYTQRTDDAPLTQSGLPSSTYGTVEWEPTGGWAQGDRGEIQQTPDLSSIVQRVVDRGGWNSGNNGLAIYMSATRLGNNPPSPLSGKRWVNSYDNVVDNNVGAAPVLHIEYSTGDKRKIEVMKESLRAVLVDAPDNVKVGLMNYGQESESSSNAEINRHHNVSGVAFPITDISAKARDVIPAIADTYGLPYFPDATVTVREYLADIADSWNQSSWTPIVDSLYEAALYFRGEKIHYGQTLPTKNGAHPSTYNGTVVATDMELVGRDYANAPKYINPMESSCQENYIVLMTDGAPTTNISGDGLNSEDTMGAFARIRNQTDGPQGALASAVPACGSPAGVGDAGTCGAELTEYLATHDNMPDPTGSFPEGKAGDQFIKTFTIGFGTGAGTNTETYLKSLATFDDGNASTNDDGYFEASTPEALAEAFQNILAAVAAPKGTLASPGYSVNVKNGLEHEKDIYIPVFDRKNSSRWSGNLKKFKIVDVNDKRLIRGKNNENATNELGAFTSSALDYWSNSPNNDPDGVAVEKGGLANLLDPNSRKIYSNLSGDSNVVLSSNANKVHKDNIANIHNTSLGLPAVATAEYRKLIVNFMRGWILGIDDSLPAGLTNPLAQKRYHMGDMLHSEPLVITYEKGSGSGTGKQQYIFAGTNEGYLHAFDTVTGEEKFAFIPAELLQTISEPQFLNAGTQADHKYGVDGSLTYWFKGGDGKSISNGGQIIVYFGLRRGGSSYYALDVTDINNPVMLWKRSYDPNTSPNKHMGQSWSVPYLDKVGVTGTTCVDNTPNCKEVVIVSGGYDGGLAGGPNTGPDGISEDRDINDGSKQLDDSTTSHTADVGNDIQIYDAMNGDVVWSMPQSMRNQITSSIPGGVRVLDTNYNGLIDRMYFGDTGGNVWRIDLSETLSNSDNSSKLTKLASLGGSGANSRKFYNEPDAAKMILNGKTVFAISIGSGFRAHPLDKAITDNFFVLIDESPYDAYTDENSITSTIVPTELATINVSINSVSQIDSIKDSGKRGWIVNFSESGEKVLGGALTVDGAVLFTTLVPEVLTNTLIDQCAAPATQANLYAIDLLTGGAILDLNGDGEVTGEDIGEVSSTEILNKVQIVYNPPVITATVDEDGDPTGEKSCRHPVDIRVGKKSSQASGYNACRLESVYWSDPQAK